MLKAGALYFAIVIAFFIAIVSASLLMLASHYRNTYLKEIRFARLSDNLNSGVVYVLADQQDGEGEKVIDLYQDQTDTIIVNQKKWGFFRLALLKTFILQDTLKKAMLIGKPIDSTVIYLSDEDRLLSLGGTTKLFGNAYLPKSGVRKAYVDGKSYANEKLLYNGTIKYSDRHISELNKEMLNPIIDRLKGTHLQFEVLNQNQINNSFLDSTLYFNLTKKAILENMQLSGNLMLFADSAVTIKASAQLQGIQVYAPYIKVEDGFKGNCQFFASDSITIGNKVYLSYPSVVAVIRTSTLTNLPKISIGNDTRLEGIVFTYEAKRSPLQTLISLGARTKVKGEIYSTGLIELQKGNTIAGKVTCNRFIMHISPSLYENFLIDVTFNRHALSPYYLSSPLFKSNLPNKVLTWLN